MPLQLAAIAARHTHLRRHFRRNDRFLGVTSPGSPEPSVPEAIQPRLAPKTGREYLLYPPSAYKREQFWSLIVTCSPSSPNRHIRPWTSLAEQHGFFVAEPVHAYAKAGTYRLTVTVSGPKLGEHTRHADITMPAVTVQPARHRP